MIIYNSRQQKYKSVFGAVAEKTDISFFVQASEDILTLTLAVKNAADGRVEERKMERAKDGFSVSFLFEEKGVYFYCFRLSDEKAVYASDGGNGTVKSEGEWFQQTVYAADYRAPEGYAGGIMYQIFPDRFNISGGVNATPFGDRKYHASLREVPTYLPDSDGEYKNNDYYGGNLKGIEEKLGYLHELGVTVIYLNPICEAHSNHRYNTADYKKVDALLGTEADFKELCESAEKLGIKVIIDGVYSHTGDDSVYFNRRGRYDSTGAAQSPDSAYRCWYKYDETKRDFVYWWGVTTLPEVNEEEPSFAEYICGEGGVIDYWMGLGASGVRLDVADELPDGFIEKIRTAVKRNNPDGLLIGEVWEDASNKISYGSRRRFLYGNELDSVMNYPFCVAVLEFIRTANAEAFAKTVGDIVENYPKPMLDNMMNFLATHDTERAINRLVFGKLEHLGRELLSEIVISTDEYLRGVEMLKLAFVLLFTLPGIPCIYYGEEIGMTGFKDPFNRGFMRWSSPDENIRSFVRKLGRTREDLAAFKDGAFELLSAKNGTVAFLRKTQDETVLVAVNRGESTATVTLPDGSSETVAPWRYTVKKI